MLAGYTHLVRSSRPLIALAQTWTQVFAVRVARPRRQGHPRRAARRDARDLGDAGTTRGKVYGFHRGMDHTGAIVGPLLASLFLFFYPGEYRTLFALTIIPGAIAVALIFFVRERAADAGSGTPRLRRAAGLSCPASAMPSVNAASASFTRFMLVLRSSRSATPPTPFSC